MPAELVGPDVAPEVRVRHLAEYLDRIDNTIQFSWLLNIAHQFYSFPHDRIDPQTIGDLIHAADHSENGGDWDRKVWEQTNLEKIFLTNDFDDPLEGWDREQYVPCLRTDDLVLKLHDSATRFRLKTCANMSVDDLASLRLALGAIVEFFVKRGAKACAVSLPPDFIPAPPSPKLAVTPIRRALHGMDMRPDEHDEVRRWVFWTLVELSRIIACHLT